MTTSTTFATATEALEALADQHETHGHGDMNRVRITHRNGGKNRMYISRRGKRLYGNHQTGDQYGTPIWGIEDIVHIEYVQKWQREKFGPLFVAEGA